MGGGGDCAVSGWRVEAAKRCGGTPKGVGGSLVKVGGEKCRGGDERWTVWCE